MHLPLSQSLAQVLAETGAPAGLTLNRLLDRTQGRGLYLVVIVLCLPFVIPFSVPGLSTILGSIIILLMLPLAIGRHPRLPRFLGERPLPPGLQKRVVGGSIAFLHFLERFVQPRHTLWLGWAPIRFVNCLLIALLAFLLALPLPAPPFFFSNSIPSYGIIVLAVSVMEEDGFLIWFGYALVVANLVFFGLLAGAVVELLLKSRRWL